VSKLHLYGFTGGFTEIRTPLVEPGWGQQAVTALVSALRRYRRRYHWCAIEGVPAGSTFGQWLVIQAYKEGWPLTRSEPAYILNLPATWDALRRGLKRNIKQSLRHCYNSLDRRGHKWEFRVEAEPGEVSSALDEFFRLHSLRAAMPDTVPHPDYFSTDRRRLFLRRVARDLCPDRRFMVARLLVNGEVVASRVLLVTGSCMFLYFSGFDPAWKSHSVMTTLTAECIKMAIAEGYETVNLSTGTDVSKTRWGPEVYPYFSVRIPSPTLEGRALFTLRQRLPMHKIGMPEKQLPRKLPDNV
jgi:CelD/BcsL family acetyltransferase involved in cellulose biosynthesis